LYLPYQVWSDSICTYPIRLQLDLESVGLAVEIPFLYHMEAEIYVFPVLRPQHWKFHFRFGSDYHNFCPRITGHLKYGVCVEMFFLSCL